MEIKIGDKFVLGDRPLQYRCTDIGTRVVVGIALDKPDASWYQGPPYAVVELVFDEDDKKVMRVIYD